MNTPRVTIGALQVDAVDLQSTVELVGSWIENRTRQYLCFCNIRSVAQSSRDPHLNQAYAHAALVVPDGMPLVWILKMFGFAAVTRVYGPDFVLAFCQHSSGKNWRHAFYGGSPGIADSMAHALHSKYPHLQIAGTWSPPFRDLSPQEEQRYISEINETKPDILWVGLGCPKQEKWIARNRAQLNAPVLAGVGYAFDVHSGIAQQAPPWMRQNGLEWFFRSLQKPSRIWSHLVVDGSIILRLALQTLLERQPQPDKTAPFTSLNKRLF